MKTQVMAVYDKKARVYFTPFFVPHTDVGVRWVKNAVNGVFESPVGKNPEDFSLHLLGSFDDDTAQFTLTASPVPVCEAIAFRPGLGQASAATIREVPSGFKLPADSRLGEE